MWLYNLQYLFRDLYSQLQTKCVLFHFDSIGLCNNYKNFMIVNYNHKVHSKMWLHLLTMLEL